MADLGPKERSLIEANEEFRNKMGVQYLEAAKETTLPGVSCGTSKAAAAASVVELDDDDDEEDKSAGSSANRSAQASSSKSSSATKAHVQGKTNTSDGHDSASAGQGAANVDAVKGLSGDDAVHGTSVSASAPSDARRRTAAEMSQMIVVEEDAVKNDEAFPQRMDGDAVLDVNNQQLDLRRHNSWVLKLHEVRSCAVWSYCVYLDFFWLAYVFIGFLLLF